MRPESCKNCCAREFIEHHDTYVCAYCDTRYPKMIAPAREISAPELAFPKYYPAHPISEPTPVEIVTGKRKNKWVAFLLCFFFGYVGAHKFYEGRIGMGILYCFTAGLFYVGWIRDCVLLLRKPNPYYV